MIRWVSPVKQFMRTATDDYVLRGVTIPAGESVLLSYPSANRDEDVFDRPTSSTSGATRTAMSGSASEPTTASAPTWPAWKRARSTRS